MQHVSDRKYGRYSCDFARTRHCTDTSTQTVLISTVPYEYTLENSTRTSTGYSCVKIFLVRPSIRHMPKNLKRRSPFFFFTWGGRFRAGFFS